MLGGAQLLVILALVLLLFGASRLPGLARAVTESIRELRTAVSHDGPSVSRREP